MCCVGRTNIYLDEEQTASLHRSAEQQGMSRPELIRRLLSRALAGVEDTLVLDLEAIEDSLGALRDLDVPELFPGDREEHLARVWRSRS